MTKIETRKPETIALHNAQIADAEKVGQAVNLGDLTLDEHETRSQLLKETVEYICNSIRNIDEQVARVTARRTSLTAYLSDLGHSPYRSLDQVRRDLLL